MVTDNTIFDIKNNILKSLLSTKDAKYTSGGSEITIYCPRCHHLHLNSGPHLYISVLNDGPMKFDCKHCSYQGLVTPKFLHEIDIKNQIFDETLIAINRQNRVLKKIGTIHNDMNREWEIPTDINKNNIFKINYLKSRTGINFTETKIKKYKIILNIKEFLNLNKIILDDKGIYSILDELDAYAIGFLSYNNNIINLRNISSKLIKTRYVNIKIDKKIMFPYLYIPPSEVDLLTSFPTIAVGEGAFDILCIRKRFFTDDSNNIIFGSVGSAGSYKRAIKKMINLTCFIGGDILIFSDKDVKLETYEKDLNEFKGIYKIKVIYNKLNKDFGEINEECKLQTCTI